MEQIQENKIFKKVASTCQKHYRKTSTTSAPASGDLLEPPDGEVISGPRTPTTPTVEAVSSLASNLASGLWEKRAQV